jgi:hypothetical protein
MSVVSENILSIKLALETINLGDEATLSLKKADFKQASNKIAFNVQMSDYSTMPDHD